MRRMGSSIKHRSAAKILAVLKWLWQVLRQWQRRRHDLALLAGMSDHQRADIGLGVAQEEEPAEVYPKEDLTKYSQHADLLPTDPL